MYQVVALLDEDSSQKQEELALELGTTRQATSKRLQGKIQKPEIWVPYELKPKDVARRLFACKQLLQRHKRKNFLNRIVTG